MLLDVTFLLYDGHYEINIPDQMNPRPDAWGAINYLGENSIVYQADRNLSGLREATEFEAMYDVRGGSYSYSVFQLSTPPVMYLAAWELPSGVLSTFIDGPIASPLTLKNIVDHIEISDSPDGVPSIRLREPLTRGNLVHWANRDAILFSSLGQESGTQLYIRLTEEPASGRRNGSGVSRMQGEAWCEVWSISELGVRVSCSGPMASEAYLRDIVEQVTGSMRLI